MVGGQFKGWGGTWPPHMLPLSPFMLPLHHPHLLQASTNLPPLSSQLLPTYSSHCFPAAGTAQAREGCGHLLPSRYLKLWARKGQAVSPWLFMEESWFPFTCISHSLELRWYVCVWGGRVVWGHVPLPLDFCQGQGGAECGWWGAWPRNEPSTHAEPC